MSQTDPAAPWVPPDPPHVPAAVQPAPPVPTGELPALPAAEASGVPRPRFGDGRLTTVLLATFAAAVVLVCGGLGAASLVLNLPDRSHPEAQVGQQQTPDGPAESEADESPRAEPAPDPTPTRKPASTPSNGPGRFAVAYAVTGQGPADILYRDADGYLIWLDKVALPWRRTVHTDDPNQLFLQAGKAEDKGGRTITCAVAVDGGRRVTETVGPGGWRCGVGG
ncbi:hypothetical protein Q2K19_15045 [Micromonospora soli]|uniref:hypothetical protein n=1 Tax=Micromonospora sp. NBRC 110009 TaxID=3061627 RepID=UPI0026719377|nr:hypothetical protein [Micromonospora sp. NBRC 110009]WKU01691.1 hypothetical protein Q2K19_15045 [Micromonospora sp. NBRC 110009]